MSPIGSWTDMLFSPEMDNALRYGYQFNILWGYTFESKIIFKDYVDTLYPIKSNSHKNDPMYHITKILLNSLYGRFGMDDNFNDINIIHKDNLLDHFYKNLDNITNLRRKLSASTAFLAQYKAFEAMNASQVDLASTSNLQEDTEKLFDDDSENKPSQDNINWDQVDISLIDNTSVKIDFSKILQDVQYVHIAANTGHTFDFKFDQNNCNKFGFNIFDMNEKMDCNKWPGIEIKEVHIRDLNGEVYSIYKNNK